MEHSHLQKWANEHDPSKTDLIFKRGFWDQIIFVRDKLAREVVYRMYDGDGDIANEVVQNLQALSTHTSKSVELPVIHMTLPDGTECVMRYNFYDWKVSIKATHPVDCDFMDLFDANEKIHGVYCEGFPAEWVFGSFSKNQQEFTLELHNEYDVWMFFYLLVRHLAAQEKAAAA